MRPLPFPVEAAAKLLRESSTLATTLLLICMSAYGEELFGDPDKGIPPMDVLELYARLEEDFRAELPEAAENRINAILMAVSTDGFYEDPLIFSSVAAALADGDMGEMPDGFMEEISLPEAMWAVYEVQLCREDEMSLSPAIMRLMEQTIEAESTNEEGEQEEGIHYEQFVRAQKLDLASQLAQINARLPIAHLAT